VETDDQYLLRQRPRGFIGASNAAAVDPLPRECDGTSKRSSQRPHSRFRDRCAPWRRLDSVGRSGGIRQRIGWRRKRNGLHAAAPERGSVRGDFCARDGREHRGHDALLRSGADPGRAQSLNANRLRSGPAERHGGYQRAGRPEAARDRLEKIKERFKTWIWGRRLGGASVFAANTTTISTASGVFNGSHLTPCRATAGHVAPAPEERAVWRIVQSDNTLLAHVVGAGQDLHNGRRSHRVSALVSRPSSLSC